MQLTIDSDLLASFAGDLDRLSAPSDRIGVAVSGGPDSVALLLLCAAARPGRIEAATVDHRLRPESADEAQAVATLCEQLQIPHAILPIDWSETPQTGLQERARTARYARLGEWMRKRRLQALATGHHLDDQAETLLMRLLRGAGVRGLAAMRPISTVPGSPLKLIRPLLGWRRSQLEAVCAMASASCIEDPSNEDERFERVRVRDLMGASDWLDPTALAKSAANLAAADEALEWAAVREWDQQVAAGDDEIAYRPSGAPAEIRRRIVARAIEHLATVSAGTPLRGRELDRVVEALGSGETATLRGVRCKGGEQWRFAPAPRRR